MDYGKAFSYVFEDKDWIKKVLIGAVVAIVPIVNFALFGYLLEVTRRVIQGETALLPEWDQFGEFFKKGFMAFVVYLVYLLPAIVLRICSAATQIGVAVAGDNLDSSTYATLSTVSGFAVLCFSCVALILTIAGILLVLPAMGVLADTGQLGAALRFGDAWNLFRANIGGYVVTLIIITVVDAVLAPIGLLVCVVGLFVVAAYISLVAGHLIGQAYRGAKGMSAPVMQQPAM
jgi:hypothetical protein